MFLIALSLMGLNSSGQALADWTFGSSTAPTSTAVGLTASDARYTTTPTSPSISSNRFRAQGWDVATQDASRYFEVTITPAASYSVTVSQFVFNVQNTGATGAPNKYLVAISANNFATSTTLGSGDVTSSPTTLTFPVSTVTKETGKVLIRAYFWGATNADRFISIGRATINGTVLSPAMPVSLVSFRGQFFGSAIQLVWETAWERNAARFEVERSANAVEFAGVGMLSAAGSAEGQRTYTFTDETPADGPNYYRLRQVDVDGAAYYSKTIALVSPANRALVRVYPNPSVGQQLQLHVRNLTAPSATLQTLTGQLIKGNWVGQTSTEATWQPDAPLPPGLYLFNMHDGPLQQAIKVLVR